MIEVFKTIENKSRRIDEFQKDSWINVSSPTKAELEKLSRELNIPLDFLTDPLDVDERARSDKEGECIQIILRTPLHDEDNTDIPFVTLPVGIILAGDLIISVCYRENNILNDFINNRIKSFSTANRSRFILQIFLRTALAYLNHLKEINKRTTGVEKELHRAVKNEKLIKLLNLEKSLVFFTTSLGSNEFMMEKLQRTGLVPMSPDDKELLGDIIVENKQAIEMASIYSNILSGMMDAFASVISNNLNVVVKLLTAITIILMIPTLVASIYGMNVELPFQHSPHAFLITSCISLTLSVIGVMVFIKRKWF
ncbi:MAG: magnesium transporter CorA family protein [Planctomycetota bacterium]